MCPRYCICQRTPLDSASYVHTYTHTLGRSIIWIKHRHNWYVYSLQLQWWPEVATGTQQMLSLKTSVVDDVVFNNIICRYTTHWISRDFRNRQSACTQTDASLLSMAHENIPPRRKVLIETTHTHTHTWVCTIQIMYTHRPCTSTSLLGVLRLGNVVPGLFWIYVMSTMFQYINKKYLLILQFEFQVQTLIFPPMSPFIYNFINNLSEATRNYRKRVFLAEDENKYLI